MSNPEIPPAAGPADHRTQLEEALVEIKRVIAGQDEMLERVLVCLVAGGHLLIEGVPGLAKTLTIKTTAAVLGGTFRRVQFTPDLVPSDLVGTRIYRPDTGGFDTEEGPVFCNFLLADEINRAPAKVQSALLEVMQERQVTIGHDTLRGARPVPRDGDAEPDRVRGHVPAARGAGRPLHAQGARRLPEPRRGADGRPALARRRRPRCGRCSRSSRCGRCSGPSLDVYVDPSLVAYAVSLAEATRDPAARRPRRRRRPRRVRRQPARPDRARPERPRARARPRPRLRARQRRARARQGRAAPPARAHLPRARRAADRRRRPRRRARARRRRRRSSSGGRSRHDGLRALGVVETPERPGPGPMPEPLLRALELTIGRRVDGLLAGDHRSHLLGRGSELAQVRPYVPGDDVRLIDWNVTARTRRAARARAARRARARQLGRARPHAVDGVRHRRPAQGRRRARRRARARPRGDAARQPARRWSSFGERRRRAAAAAAGTGGPRRAAASRSATRAPGTGVAPRARAGADHARRRGAAARRSSSSSPTSAARATGGGRSSTSPAATTCSRSRSATRASSELVDVGEVWFADPETGPAPPRRHERRAAARALRRGRRRRAPRGRRRPRRRPRVARRPLHRAATGCARSPRTWAGAGELRHAARAARAARRPAARRAARACGERRRRRAARALRHAGARRGLAPRAAARSGGCCRSRSRSSR